jgi:mono/diheme cytochrome c family protein
MRTTYWAGLLAGVALLSIFMVARGQEISAPTRLIDSVEGVDLYRAYCATCHGTDARGDGPLAKFLRTKTPDLTHIAKRNGGTFPLERVEKIITGAEALPAGHGTFEMPVWGPVFSRVTWDRDLGKVRIHNLATYLETLQIQK